MEGALKIMAIILTISMLTWASCIIVVWIGSLSIVRKLLAVVRINDGHGFRMISSVSLLVMLFVLTMIFLGIADALEML